MKKLLSIIVVIIIVINNIYDVSSITSQYQHIYGYAFIDSDLSGVRQKDSQVIVELPIQLWKNHDLLSVVKTDHMGYYEFYIPLSLDSYTLTSDVLNNYQLSSLQFHNQEANQFSYDQNQIPSYRLDNQFDKSLKVNIGFYEKKHSLKFDMNGGYSYQSLPSCSYYFQDIVNLSYMTTKKEGYLLKEWNTLKDGTGQSYTKDETFIMPSHPLTLYAIWTKIGAQSSLNQSRLFKEKRENDVRQEVILVACLLILFFITLYIVKKSLKNRKSR